jgi:hypothetical protein
VSELSGLRRPGALFRACGLCGSRPARRTYGVGQRGRRSRTQESNNAAFFFRFEIVRFAAA